MKHRFFVLIGATCLMAWTSVPAAGQAPAATAGRVDKTWSPARLPDGQPDIQGIWTNFDNTPFQAPSPDDATRLAALRKWFHHDAARWEPLDRVQNTLLLPERAATPGVLSVAPLTPQGTAPQADKRCGPATTDPLTLHGVKNL